MPLTRIDDKFLFVRMELAPTEIPDLLKAHREHWEPPEMLETEAQELCVLGFPDVPAGDFAEKVIRWGRGQRFVGRFRQKNSDKQIATALKLAASLVDQGEVSPAVSEVQKLEQLGQSFASKLVRFIRPESAVILDDVIRSSLGYRDSSQGYDEFLSGCKAVLDTAHGSLPYLRICDVEAAIFAKLQGY